MRLFRLFTTALLVAVIVLFIRQNMTTFDMVLPFSLNLYIREQVQWTHQVGSLLLAVGLMGVLIGMALMLKPWLHLRKLVNEERKARAELEALLHASEAAEVPGGESEPSESGRIEPPERDRPPRDAPSSVERP